jgi:hypothetical protein
MQYLLKIKELQKPLGNQKQFYRPITTEIFYKYSGERRVIA